MVPLSVTTKIRIEAKQENKYQDTATNLAMLILNTNGTLKVPSLVQRQAVLQKVREKRNNRILIKRIKNFEKKALRKTAKQAASVPTVTRRYKPVRPVNKPRLISPPNFIRSMQLDSSSERLKQKKLLRETGFMRQWEFQPRMKQPDERKKKKKDDKAERSTAKKTTTSQTQTSHVPEVTTATPTTSPTPLSQTTGETTSGRGSPSETHLGEGRQSNNTHTQNQAAALWLLK
jgi:hypothetical protein